MEECKHYGTVKYVKWGRGREHKEKVPVVICPRCEKVVPLRFTKLFNTEVKKNGI